MVENESNDQAQSSSIAQGLSHGYMNLPHSDLLDPQILGKRIRNVGEHLVEEIYLDDDNTEEIEHFKYKHELKKNFSLSSIVGLGFSLMNVPFGVSTTLSVGLICGGCVTLIWGWLIFGFFTLLTAVSLGEITSKFPTSGGVYHFSYLLANKKYALPISWFAGWFLIIGNWLMFISCAFGGSQFILSIFGLKQSDYKHNDWIVLLLYIILVIISALINLQFQKYLEKLNKLCIYWTIYTIIIMDFLLLIFSTEYHDLKYIFTNFDASRSGWPAVLAFMIGSVQFSSMTFNGYGSITSMSEEVNQPEKTIPRGIVISVLLSTFIGIVFIIPILAILPDFTRLLDDNSDIFPIDIVFKLSTRSFLVSIVLVLLIVGSLFFATIGTLTTASRTVYAFGRDHGLPFDSLWRKVDTKQDEEIVPTNALLLSVGIAFIMGFFSLISSSAFSAFIGCSVISLNIANGIPIFLSILDKRSKVRGSAFKLRKFGYLINGLSCLFVLLTVVLLSFPPSIYISIQSMNYAFVVFFTFAVIITILWLAWGRDHFQGPQIDHDNFILPSSSSAIPLTSIPHAEGSSSNSNFTIQDTEIDTTSQASSNKDVLFDQDQEQTPPSGYSKIDTNSERPKSLDLGVPDLEAQTK